MKIYTKTGDDGTTGLQNGKRVKKSNPRIVAYGAVDELNSTIGILLSHELTIELKQILTRIQNDLFVMGADLSNPDLADSKNRIEAKQIEFIEENIDKFEKTLEPITNFILPGGVHEATLAHFIRAVARRAETSIVELSQSEEINKNCIKYVNRLSDFFFVLSRIINKTKGFEDVFWIPKKDTL